MKTNLLFSTHALRRMLRHGIRSTEVREVLERGERIEEDPDDTPFPSYLMLGTFGWRSTSWLLTTLTEMRRS